MSRRPTFVLLYTSLCLLSACAKPQSEARSEKPIARAAELDLLEPWIGEWDTTGEEHEAGTGRVMKMTSHESIRWSCDRQFLVEESTWTTDKPGDKGSSLAVRTWDPHEKLFRSWYFSSEGTVGHSKMTYDAAKKTWHVDTKNNDPRTCEPVRGEMLIRQTDPATLEWTFTEWDGLKLHKRVEMKGVSRKK